MGDKMDITFYGCCMLMLSSYLPILLVGQCVPLLGVEA